MIRPLLPALVFLATTLKAENWNQFRGPRLDGTVTAPELSKPCSSRAPFFSTVSR